MCMDFTEGWCGHMSVYDDTDYAYGSGRCCWCGARCWEYGVRGCSILSCVQIDDCRDCNDKNVPTVNRQCSDCYKKN